MKESLSFIQFFRQAAPYIHQHRHKTFVFCIQDDETTQSVLKSILHDIAIVHSLGARIVIVFGARHTLNQRLRQQRFHQQYRITDNESIRQIQEIVGALKIKIFSTLSMGLAHSPMPGAVIEASSGNFVIAKPIGVVDGVDFGLTGEIRKVRTKAITERLQNDNIVIIPPLGFSSTGEVFNLTTEDVAYRIAADLSADKLIFFNDDIVRFIDADKNSKAITPKVALQLAADDISMSLRISLSAAAKACDNGIKRAHIIAKITDGGLLVELFSRDGFGLMITDEAYDRIEQATFKDIPSLLELIRPLEQQGILVRRSRRRLEMEISHFSLLKKDNSVIGCAALYPYTNDNMAELGCLAISPEYQNNGLADRLLNHIERQALQQGIERLFCLTTKTSQWFREKGFEPVELAILPRKKQDFYNFSRQSKCFLKILRNM